jgi:hypothetical protein
LVAASTVELQSTNGTLKAAFESSDRPTNILVRNLTFRFTTGHIDLTGIEDSEFEYVRFQGPLTNLTSAAADVSGDSLVYFENTDKIGTVVNGLEFDGCCFENAYRAVNFTQINPYTSTVLFKSCDFEILNGGIEINGVADQVNRWTLEHCKFEQIAGRAFTADYGTGTKILSSRFIDCGNNVNLADNPEQSIVVFEQAGNNIVDNCSFNRHQAAYTNIIIGDERTAYPEVLNSGSVSINDEITQTLYQQVTPTPLAMFSTLNRKTIINYVVAFATGNSRYGTLTITVGDNLMDPIITDDYSVSQDDTAFPPSVSPSSDFEALEFSVTLVDRSDSTAGSETMVLKYKNPILAGSHKLTYFVTYGV